MYTHIYPNQNYRPSYNKHFYFSIQLNLKYLYTYCLKTIPMGYVKNVSITYFIGLNQNFRYILMNKDDDIRLLFRMKYEAIYEHIARLDLM